MLLSPARVRRAVCAAALLSASPALAQGPAARPHVAPEAADAVADAAVGRWLALSVDGDEAASADLRRGTLVKVLVVNPGGHVILRGSDRRADWGRPVAFSGRLAPGGALALGGLPGEATLALDGRRLVLTDPRGVRTRFVRYRLPDEPVAPARAGDGAAGA